MRRFRIGSRRIPFFLYRGKKVEEELVIAVVDAIGCMDKKQREKLKEYIDSLNKKKPREETTIMRNLSKSVEEIQDDFYDWKEGSYYKRLQSPPALFALFTAFCAALYGVYQNYEDYYNHFVSERDVLYKKLIEGEKVMENILENNISTASLHKRVDEIIDEARMNANNPNLELSKRAFSVYILSTHSKKDANFYIYKMKKEIDSRAQIHIYNDAATTYKKLVKISPYLPTIYAKLIYRIAKLNRDNVTDEMHILLNKAVKLREEIDKNKVGERGLFPACRDYYNTNKTDDTVLFKVSGEIFAHAVDKSRLNVEKALQAETELRYLQSMGNETHHNNSIKLRIKLLRYVAENQGCEVKTDEYCDQAIKVVFGTTDPEVIKRSLKEIYLNFEADDQNRRADYYQHAKYDELGSSVNNAYDSGVFIHEGGILKGDLSEMSDKEVPYIRTQIRQIDRVIKEVGKVFVAKYRNNPKVNANSLELAGDVVDFLEKLEQLFPEQVADFIKGDINRLRGKVEQLKSADISDSNTSFLYSLYNKYSTINTAKNAAER